MTTKYIDIVVIANSSKVKSFLSHFQGKKGLIFSLIVKIATSRWFILGTVRPTYQHVHSFFILNYLHIWLKLNYQRNCLFSYSTSFLFIKHQTWIDIIAKKYYLVFIYYWFFKLDLLRLDYQVVFRETKILKII